MVDPHETLEFEVKNWLDLQENNDNKAVFAKAVLALSNHGGGVIALGLLETDAGIIEAEGRPATLDGYNQDLINGIVTNYCDPPFHCAVQIVPDPSGALFPMVTVPGGHHVPVRARRAGPNDNIIKINAIYIRKPGPRSETPQTGREWDILLAKCMRNRREEMFGQIRDLITGAVPQIEQPAEPERLEEWIRTSRERWNGLVEHLPEDVSPRFPHGTCNLAYEILGESRQIPLGQLPAVIRSSGVDYTGLPPFWYPTRQGIEPYPFDNAVECWLGGDPRTPPADRHILDSDFWRVRSDGLAYLLRGYQEDGMEFGQRGGRAIQPGTQFDINLPIWRVGETLLQAERLATNLFNGPTTITFVVTYEGLSGRSLTSIDGRRPFLRETHARQPSKTLSTHIDTAAIDSNLPEIIHPLLGPLYDLFGFFELPMTLVIEELDRMRARGF